MRRFVILAHDWPFPHFDFMLEEETTLRTWRLAEPPHPGQVLAAEEIAPHRLAFLDYEGPVSGDRGHVTRWDAGTYLPMTQPGDSLTVELHGRKIRGTVRLRGEAARQELDCTDLSSEKAGW